MNEARKSGRNEVRKMARDLIGASTKDLVSDGGSILLSMVRGEQLELAVILDFLDVADSNYEYEAVLIEGLNNGLGSRPDRVQPAGISSSLVYRLCNYRDTWDALTAYDIEDVVLYNGSHYKLSSGSARVSSSTPIQDDLWKLHDPRTVYIQFTDQLSAYYTGILYPNIPMYAFFELRVTELYNPIFNNTWKPVRGLVQFLFSPTDIV